MLKYVKIIVFKNLENMLKYRKREKRSEEGTISN